MSEPTYNGRKANRGRIVIGKPYQEGYAILKCGGTEVQISYTVLHNCMRLNDYSGGRFARETEALKDAIDSITCEASLGNNGE